MRILDTFSLIHDTRSNFSIETEFSFPHWEFQHSFLITEESIDVLAIPESRTDQNEMESQGTQDRHRRQLNRDRTAGELRPIAAKCSQRLTV